MSVDVFVHACMHMCVCVHSCMHVCVCVYACEYERAHTHTHTHTHMHNHNDIWRYVHVEAHTRTQLFVNTYKVSVNIRYMCKCMFVCAYVSYSTLIHTGQCVYTLHFTAQVLKYCHFVIQLKCNNKLKYETFHYFIRNHNWFVCVFDIHGLEDGRSFPPSIQRP